MANGTGGTLNPVGPLAEFRDIVTAAPEETVGKWISHIRERYNLHPHPEATMEDLRAWLIHVQYDILPALHGGGSSDPNATIDPFFNTTPAQ